VFLCELIHRLCYKSGGKYEISLSKKIVEKNRHKRLSEEGVATCVLLCIV
jgi:hypothetical protein